MATSRQEAFTEPAPRRRAPANHKQTGIKVTKTIRRPSEPEKHTPSAYLAQMRLNTEERLANVTEMYPPTITELLDITSSSHQKDFSVSMDQALFQPFPSEVVFQQFQPHQMYEFPLNFRNNDRVARHLKVTHEDSPYFRVVCQRPAGSKVAPGMEVTYLILFTPDEKKDYHLELVCVTERERFVVPVRAVGVRALLDFPDDIHFPASPVKYPSSTTILVRNVGDKEAQFTLQTKSPYSVAPTSASLEVGHCMQVTITFHPTTVGDFFGELTVHYDTGESVHSWLHGSSVDVNVRLDRRSLKMENTYIRLSTQRSVILHNRSKVVVHYQWKAFSSVEEEEAQRLLRLTTLEEKEVIAQEVLLERSLHDPTMRDRLPIVTHSLAHKKKCFVDMEKFLFSDENISIDSVEGEIWPNSQAEMSVIFTPSESASYSRVAYCDVTGRESRLPLRVTGQGIGPRLMFSFDTLDIQNVFINSAHAYEVILENKGDIDAGYNLIPPSSLFGPFFTFSPSSGVLQPGALQSIQISFQSTILGEFSEEFQWAVGGSPAPLSLRITGVVIPPTFQFDPTHIKFGTVPYGFLSSREVVLTNTSDIPMTYHLRVSSSEAEGQGEGEKVDEGTEFDVEPKHGVLPANYRQSIRVNFVPAAVKVYSKELILFVAEAGEEKYSLPISANSEVPTIRLETPYLDYGRCFLQYPYTLTVTLTNPSRLPVRYQMDPPQDKRILHYSTDPSSGVIDPQTTLELPLQIEPLVVGEVITTAVFMILGSLEPPLEVAIRFVGEGPVINVSSTELHWGRQPVLTPLLKTVYLSNESLIPAEYECVLSRERTVFSVEPPSGVIAPQETLELIVTATIDDCLRFTDKVTVVVSKGVNITISLSAEGEGTTIVSQPPLQPKVDLGPHFCNSWPCQKQFALMNRGRRLQALSWTTQGFSTAKLKKMEIKRANQDLKDVGRKRPQPEPELKRPVFRIIPDKFALEPFETCVITLEGSSQEPKSVAERLVCHAIIGKNAHKERIMTVDVLANFISPLTQFSTREISFTSYQTPGSELVQQAQSLSLQNVSPLPFTAVLMCIYPFTFNNVRGKLQQLEVDLAPSQKKDVVIQFDPSYCRDRCSRTEENQLVVAYKEHPMREHLSLKAKVYFPNIEFESTDVDFGCILNDTETIQYVQMTNTSPLEVQYKWYFLRRPPVRRQDPEQCDEGVDMQSECETDSLTEDSQEESQEEEEEEGEDEGDGEGGEVEQTSEREGSLLECDPDKSQEKEAVECSRNDLQASGNSRADENEEGESLESPADTANVQEATAPVVIPTVAASVAEYSDPTAVSVAHVQRREKQPWEVVDDPFKLVRIEQIFDILPLHGTLLPRESQQVQFTFYGYTDIATECVAACKVDGGPTYQVRLRGEASNVQYRFNHKHIDFEEQLYGQVLTTEIVLYNTGKVDMDFTTFGVSGDSHLSPGEISVQPPSGHIEALDNMKLTVTFLPGVPERFQKTFQVQVAHLQADEITLVGEGVFPRIGFDLPSQLLDPGYSDHSQLRESALGTTNTVSDDSLLLEMERLLVKQFLTKSSEETDSLHVKKGKLRPSLPPYQLDFGYVVYGSVETRRVTLTNTGSYPVSFNTSHKTLEGTGFSLDLVSKVRALPGSPEAESLEFSVQFDPAAVQCPLGHIQALLPFNLFNGPVYSLLLSATVTKPALQLSRHEIDFETVVCGQCRIATVRISNPFHVSCRWSAVTNKPPKKVPKHVPMHLRRKMKDKPPPTYYEVDPPSGILQPGQRNDIRIRFMPTEELDYEDTIPFKISHNPDSDTVLVVKGSGSEPRVEFDRQMVQFPAVLPFADGSEAEVLVTNPQPYAVEIYSLEFDKQYLEEEEILRWVKGYDGQKRLFLPPIVPGEKLPKEILQAWEKTKPTPLSTELPSREDMPSTMEGSEAEIEPKLPSLSANLLPGQGVGEGRTPGISTTALLSVPELGIIESLTGLTNDDIEGFSQVNMDGMDVPPVAAAVARHMGIDLSPEGAKSELRKGIALVVEGPPMSGQTSLARALAEKYKAALINVDELLKDLISKAETPEGRKLRQLCIDAEAEQQAQEEAPSATTTHTTGKKLSTKDIKDKEPKESAPKQEEVQQPVVPFSVLPLLDTDLAVPESSLKPVPLPKDMIIQILENRLQQQDCRHGVVFDGVESVFASCLSSALRIILELIHNRKHIYVAKIEMELSEIKERRFKLEKEAEMRAKKEQRLREEKEKEEKERAKREMEIDEEEYEALGEEDRIKFDQKLLAVKKEKSRIKQKEKEARERIEHEREEEERRIAEELKKKKGKGRKVPTVAALSSSSRPTSRPTSGGTKLSRDGHGMASQASVSSGLATPGKSKAKSPGVATDSQIAGADPLDKKFEYYAHHSPKVETLLADWDRVARVDRPLPPPEVPESLTPVKKSTHKSVKPQPSTPAPSTVALPEINRDELGVPHVALKGSKPTDELVDDLLNSNNIPTPEEVLETLGLGPDGPLIAEPVTFQVYPYPLKRMKLTKQNHFTFIAASTDDPNSEKVEPPPSEVPPEPLPDPQLSQSRKRSESRQSPLKRRKGTSKAPSPLPGVVVEEEQKEKVEKKPSKHTKLAGYRWVVPARGQRKIKLLFSSKECGQFDHTFNFEVAGTRQRYQLFCRGQCHVPSICRDLQTIFTQCKKYAREDEIVHKRYVLSDELYVFGPLLASKSRERYKKGLHPENMEKLTISNPGKITSEVSFFFRDDADGTTYILDPPTMNLEPGESQTLTVWAFPEKCTTYSDALVCCIKHNPNPVVIPITCTGVVPEIKFEQKQIDFKKVLLHRKQTNVLSLTNPTLIPVAWKLSGLEQLGDEFSFNQEQGVVQPKTTFPLQVSFRAAKPVTVLKKSIKVEISDVERKHMGLVQIENIAINAEAYDVAMDISFPRGTDGGLDFPCVFAGSDHKLLMQLKNKGKYDIGFAFSFNKASNGKSYSNMLKVVPSHAVLYATEKATSVSVVFHSTTEVTIKDESILKCEVIDRHVGDQGEVIACIPIKVSAKAVFSKFSLSPTTSINFGAMTVNTKKQCSFVLENCGEFDFRYAIVAADGSQKKPAAKAGRASSRAREGQESVQTSSLLKVEGGKGGGKSKAEVACIRTEVVSGTARLVLGMFTIQPATGMIAAGQSSEIKVDCIADRPGKQVVALIIEISDRFIRDPPIVYHIYGDVLEPAINTTDIGAIFEEHGVCQSLGVMGPQLFHRKGCVGVYGEAERRFAFKSVIVGQSAQARFKIINSTKIPCDAKLVIASTSSKHKGTAEGFDVEPKSKFYIPSHSHVFATVIFQPTTIQTYTAMFEAYPEDYKQKALTFELHGDGNLPQVEVTRPTLKNAKGQPLLVFRRLLTDQSQTLKVNLRNVGTIPAVVQMRIRSGKQHFTVVVPGSEEDAMNDGGKPDTSEGNDARNKSASPPLSLSLDVGETRSFPVIFHPSVTEKCQGELSLRVRDNQFETISIQLVGEGYQDDVSIRNIHGGADRDQMSVRKGSNHQPEKVEASHENSLDFGDFAVGESRQITFSLSNCGTEPVKFQWPTSLPGLSFSPSTGHLHPSTSKDVSVTFRSDKPVTLKQEHVPGKIWKIKFRDPLGKVRDWDDRHKTIHWVNIPIEAASLTEKPLPSPAKKKVVEVEAEPLNTALDDSRRDLVLSVWATVDHVQYTCPSKEIRFTDTLLYQTRVYKLPLNNTGQIPLSYSWSIVHMDGSPITPCSSQLQLEKSTGNIAGEGGEIVPFSISPSVGEILPEKAAVFSVSFSPLDVREWECKLVCSIPHLDSSNGPLEVVISGKALMPHCHFELEPSDYSVTRQSGGEGSAHSTQAFEFHSAGIGIKIVKQFEVINPTLHGYEFNWTYEGRPTSSLQPSSFKCLTPKGFIEAGKTFEMAFEFTPMAKETVESLWRFSIPALSQSFLLVGHTMEPAVLLDRAYINFHSLKLGSTHRETVYLVNNEPTAQSFDFVKRSCYSSGHSARVKVNPLQGTVEPHSRLPIEVSFTASLPQEFSFNLECRVKHKPTPLRLNVKAQGYEVKMELSFTNTSGETMDIPLHSTGNCEINFGKVPICERALGQVTIVNHGDNNLEYNWILSEECAEAGAQGCQLVSVNRAQGTVEARDRTSCELVFAPPKKTTLKNCTLTLKVVNGPTIPISILGSGVEPRLVFSPKEVDFGMCFLQQAEMSPRRTTVVITNKEKEDMSIKCLFENKLHFEVHSEQCLLRPGETSEFLVVFRPTQAISYEDKIEFEVNGLSKTSIAVRGVGVPMKVELADPTQKTLNVGALRVSNTIKKEVVLINRSPIPLTLSVSLVTTSHQLQEDSTVLCVDTVDGKTLQPNSELTLKAKNGAGKVMVTFAPKARIAHFQEEVMMESSGMSQPLFMVTGSCLGHEIQLDMDHIPFGTVCHGSQTSRHILIINSGDIGASFKWELEKFAPDFSISPTEGYLSPGMEVPLEVTFHPQKVERDIRYERLPCQIEGSSPLLLTLSGICTEQKPEKEIQQFTTTVRTKKSKQLPPIRNDSNTVWRLSPVIGGQQWTGPDSLTINPNSTGHYELTYHPLTMTSDTAKHHGTVFFPLPNGNGLLYNLQGTAEPPDATASTFREIPCKTPHTELLKVKNWIRRPQRFRVIRELVRPEKLDQSVSLHGMDYIDVPALGKKDYKLHFYSFKECTITAKVTFMIEQTGEYILYNVTFKSTPSGIMDTIQLSTQVRRSVSHDIVITNPLNTNVTFSASTTIHEISLPPNFVVGPDSKLSRTFEYLPLRAGETVGKLIFTSSELGAYQYELHLTATPPTPEPPIHFTCHLGKSKQQQCKVPNYAKGTRVEYSCKIVNGDNTESTNFHVDKSIMASGAEVIFEVNFEPSHLGDSQTTLYLSSSQGGDYTVPLFGHCLSPHPEGPHVVKAGQTITIPFKNVFPQTMQFSYSVNCPVFSVKAADTIKPRKTCNVQVTYDAKQADPHQTKTGKLVVTSLQSARSAAASRGHTPPPTSWVFYLKGTPP